jgi:hypothetical protein
LNVIVEAPEAKSVVAAPRAVAESVPADAVKSTLRVFSERPDSLIGKLALLPSLTAGAFSMLTVGAASLSSIARSA